MSDSDEEIEQWKNQLHEVTTLNCNMIVRSLRRVMIEVRELPTDVVAMKAKEPIDCYEMESL